MRVRAVHAGKCISCPKCSARVGVPNPETAWGIEDLAAPAGRRAARKPAWSAAFHKLTLILVADAAAFSVAGILIGRLFMA